MKTIIHVPSGAVVGTVIRLPTSLAPETIVIDGNLRASDQWYDGTQVLPREDAEISIPDPVVVGQLVTITKPEGAFVRLPAGEVTSDVSFVVAPGYKTISLALVGRWRGEVQVTVGEGDPA